MNIQCPVESSHDIMVNIDGKVGCVDCAKLKSDIAFVHIGKDDKGNIIEVTETKSGDLRFGKVKLQKTNQFIPWDSIEYRLE